MKLTKQTIKEIRESFESQIKHNGFCAIEHQWSANGMGSSKIFMGDTMLSKATGCGYDRFGYALGEAIMAIMPGEVFELAKKSLKESVSQTYIPTEFYGLFFDSTENKAWLDGACGDACMQDVLKALGFELCYVGATDYKKSKGSVFYTIRKKVSEK